MNKSFHMHPVVYKELVKGFPENGQPAYSSFGMFGGIPVYINDNLPIWNKKWRFPRDPFVDYEKLDEAWARPLGYGCEVDDVGNYCVMQLNEWRLPTLGFGAAG